MRPLAIAIIVFAASSLFALAAAQDRSTELDKAAEEAKAAYLALQEAEKRREAGVESQPGERLGTAGGDAGGPGGGIGGRRGGGGARQSDEYWQRQAQLEREVEAARQRYEAAQKRWNELK